MQTKLTREDAIALLRKYNKEKPDYKRRSIKLTEDIQQRAIPYSPWLDCRGRFKMVRE